MGYEAKAEGGIPIRIHSQWVDLFYNKNTWALNLIMSNCNGLKYLMAEKNIVHYKLQGNQIFRNGP